MYFHSKQKNNFSATYHSSYYKMLVKVTNLTWESANINEKLKIVETKYEYFNAPSKHFVGSRNPFLFVFVCWSGIWIALAYTSMALAHLSSIEKMHRLHCSLSKVHSSLFIVHCSFSMFHSSLSNDHCSFLFIVHNK